MGYFTQVKTLTLFRISRHIGIPLPLGTVYTESREPSIGKTPGSRLRDPDLCFAFG